ncbi:hypothetical protein G6F65_017876 [Rhizopus arrhizus]|nr:hypothetical protein G6F65_017876 [Rhizopus arrhizus]
MRKVMHGDKVLARVTGIDHRGRREGSIARVLERGMTRLIGRFSVEMGINYVVPDDKRVQRNVQVPPDQTGGARDGQLVVCELTQAPDSRRPPIGRIIAVLGDKLTASLVVETAIHGHELPFEFPQEVLDEAASHAAGHHRRRGCQGLRRRGVLRAECRWLPPGGGDRRCLQLRAPRHVAGRGGAEARDLGVLPGLRGADAAGDPVQRHLLADAQGRPHVLRLRHADRPRRPGHSFALLRSGDELARAPDLHPGVEGGGRG